MRNRWNMSYRLQKLSSNLKEILSPALQWTHWYDAGPINTLLWSPITRFAVASLAIGLSIVSLLALGVFGLSAWLAYQMAVKFLGLQIRFNPSAY